MNTSLWNHALYFFLNEAAFFIKRKMPNIICRLGPYYVRLRAHNAAKRLVTAAQMAITTSEKAV